MVKKIGTQMPKRLKSRLGSIGRFVAKWLTFGYRPLTHMLLVDKYIYPLKDIRNIKRPQIDMSYRNL